MSKQESPHSIITRNNDPGSEKSSTTDDDEAFIVRKVDVIVIGRCPYAEIGASLQQ